MSSSQVNIVTKKKKEKEKRKKSPAQRVRASACVLRVCVLDGDGSSVVPVLMSQICDDVDHDDDDYCSCILYII